MVVLCLRVHHFLWILTIGLEDVWLSSRFWISEKWSDSPILTQIMSGRERTQPEASGFRPSTNFRLWEGLLCHPRALEIWGAESLGPSPASDPAKRSREGRAVQWLMWTPVDVGSMWSPDLKSLGKMGVCKLRNDGENEKRLAEVNGKLLKRSWWKCHLQLAEFGEGIPISQPISKKSGLCWRR